MRWTEISGGSGNVIVKLVESGHMYMEIVILSLYIGKLPSMLIHLIKTK